jgi:hypothetical protein
VQVTETPDAVTAPPGDTPDGKTESSLAGTGRCSTHPHNAAIETCDECGRELCMSCAIPFRNRVLGPECASKILGQEPAFAPADDRRRRPPRLLTGVGFVVASLASVFAWKKFGEGSGSFGAWGMSPRWSILAAVAAIAGVLVWATVALGRKRPGVRWILALRILSVLVVGGAVLHLLRPPPFGPSSFGPWVAIAGGIAALAGTFNRRIPSPAQESTSSQ